MKIEGSDWIYLGLSAEELKEYILSEQIFWQLSPGKERFTIGNYLLAEKKLSASVLIPDDRARLEKQTAIYQEVHSSWKANWNSKVKKEWLTRLNLWQQYLLDLRKDRENAVWSYPSEVRIRVILQILEDEIGSVDLAHKSNLNSLDRLLHSLSREGEFVWEKIYSKAFPDIKFWFLYRSFS